jgi:microcystin-dependent protein
MCDGLAYNQYTYTDLYAVIGTDYGTDFYGNPLLPNLKGRVIVGKDASDSDFDTLNETQGSKTHTLTTDEMPNHRHETYASRQTNTTATGSNGRLTGLTSSPGANQGNTSYEGGGNAHNNIQPSLVLNYIIKT